MYKSTTKAMLIKLILQILNTNNVFWLNRVYWLCIKSRETYEFKNIFIIYSINIVVYRFVMFQRKLHYCLPSCRQQMGCKRQCVTQSKMTHAHTRTLGLVTREDTSAACVYACVANKAIKTIEITIAARRTSRRGDTGSGHSMRSGARALACELTSLYINKSPAYQWRRSANRATATNSVHVCVWQLMRKLCKD